MSRPRAPSECWLHPAAVVRPSRIEGKGLFARRSLEAGVVVARLGGGRVVTRAQLLEMFAAAESDPDEAYVDCLSIAEGFDLVLPANQDLHFGNHSCDPNLWHIDAFTVATRCEIGEGEELTIDYGTQTDGDLRMECSCGSPLCRGRVTGSDWQRADLQARYGDHWVPVLLERIRRERL